MGGAAEGYLVVVAGDHYSGGCHFGEGFAEGIQEGDGDATA